MSDNSNTPQELKTLFNQSVIEKIGEMVVSAEANFDVDSFVERSLENFESLALKQRSAQIADRLYSQLNRDFEQVVEVLLKAMGKDNGSGGVEGYTDFIYLPFLDVVERFGLDFPEVSLKTLEHMTLFFSAEFAVRPYILEYRELALTYLGRWSQHDDWRVRRLASEGSRPRLPWGIQLKPFIEDPSPTLRILDRLHGDENLVVRRSVANHLNDIAKDNEQSTVETAKRWWDTGNKDSQWTVKHGLRTLVKKGNPQALAVLGFVGGDNIVVSNFELSSETVRIGDEMSFRFELQSSESEPSQLVVDYALERPLANGKKAKKVFKLKMLTMSPNEATQLAGKQAFKQLSTRTYYPGTYAIEVLVNGRVAERKTFVVDN
ncbi:hypothetical protein EYS14_14675 [Alteromonadaceae bacterium M269]|nr:hypothetical protein EYS14_14675 [Alteromonadaceae bacterium M269]